MRGFVIIVLLSLTIDGTSGMGSIQLIPQFPLISGSVTFSITGVTEKISTVNWYKGPTKNPENHIVKRNLDIPSLIVYGLSHNSRFSSFETGSLEIKELYFTDNGTYIAEIKTAKSSHDIKVNLTVYEPVIKPKITASPTQPKENHPFNLTCITSRAMKITWSRRGSRISSVAKYSTDNKILKFSSIKQRDAGEYQCEAQNLASKALSDPYTVTVAYGPRKAEIRGRLYVNPGSPITLSCSADSFPPPEYQWKVNGTESQEKTDKYYISHALTEDEGTYTCVVRNRVTRQTNNASVYLNVTTEYQEPTDVEYEFFIGLILGLIFAVIFGLVLIIFGSVCLYQKYVTKKQNESSENRRENIPVYENMAPSQPEEESSYRALQFISEDTYTELNL